MCLYIKCKCIHTWILVGCLHESSQELFGCETTIFSFSSKPCFIKTTRSNVAKFYCPPVPRLVPSSFMSKKLLFMAKRQPINLAMFRLLSPFPAPARRETTPPGSGLGTSGLATLLLHRSTSQEGSWAERFAEIRYTCSCTSAKGWPATIPKLLEILPSTFPFNPDNPLLFPLHDLLPWHFGVSTPPPPPLQLLVTHLSLCAVHHGQNKAGKQEVPSAKGLW